MELFIILSASYKTLGTEPNILKNIKIRCNHKWKYHPVIQIKSKNIKVKPKKLTTLTCKEVLFAKSFSFEVARIYWSMIKRKSSVKWHLRQYTEGLIDLNKNQLSEAKNFAETLSDLDILKAGYSIANKYAALLPVYFRQKYGVFFTPLAVVEKMLNDIEKVR